MKKISYIRPALLSTLGVLMYITIVAWIMIHSDAFFGPMKGSLLGPILFLLLFVTSAAIVGLAIFGRPVYLFFSGQKEDAVQLLLYTIGMLIAAILISIIILATASTAHALDLSVL